MQTNQFNRLRFFSLILGSGLIVGKTLALPIIAVPNLIYKVSESSVVSYSEAGAGQVTTAGVNVSSNLSREVTKELPLLNADVRGELIKSGHYKVIDMKNKFALSQSELNQALSAKAIRQLNSDILESADFAAPTRSVEDNSKNLKPDYILLGFVTNRDSGENIYPIANTNKQTQTYSTDILVDYRLVDYDTKQVVASFSASGRGSDIKIMSNNNDGRVIHYNYTKALKEASKDLATDVLSQLDAQFKVSDKVKQEEAPRVITDVKTYTDQ